MRFIAFAIGVVSPVDFFLFQEERNTAPCAHGLRTLQWRKGHFEMTFSLQFPRPTLLPATLSLLAATALTVSGTSPARRDRSDDLAGQLRNQIDRLPPRHTPSQLVSLSP